MAIVLQRSRLWRVVPLAATALLFAAGRLSALQDGLARTPPMGFNTWNYYGCEGNSEAVILKVANAMVAKHPANWEGKEICLRDVGYEYVNLDDCWQGERDPSGYPCADPNKFPRGIKWLADSVHALGLKIGIYSCAGYKTCAGRFGVYNDHGGYDSIDARAYADWGIDYLKHDWCYVDTVIADRPSTRYHNAGGAILLYSRMRDALKAAGRPIVFSLCQWGNYEVPKWGDSIGHLWRTGGDIQPNWASVIKAAYININGYSGSARYDLYQKPGAWNDADMLQIGNGQLTMDENKAHFDLWCIMATPLLLGNNLLKMPEEIFTIVSNREVIAVNQDSLGIQGRMVTATSDPMQVWVKRLASADSIVNRRCAVVIVNNGSRPASVTVSWDQLGERDNRSTYRVRDLWKHEDVAAEAVGSFTVENIPSHGSAHLIFTRNGGMKVWNARDGGHVPARQLHSRVTAAGFSVFIPLPGCRVAIFDTQGRRVNEFTAQEVGWRPLGVTAAMNRLSIVRVTTANGETVRRAFIPVTR